MANVRVVGNRLAFEGKTYRCAFGKGGFSVNKKEGDGATPVGMFALRECWYRADRMALPETKLPLRIIHENDGWCDDPKSPHYNRHVTLPFVLSHEKLFRQEPVYDLIIPIGYNDGPFIAGKGSAIFMHIARVDYEPTEGCIALAKADLLEILPHLDTQSLVDIRPA